MQARTVQVGSMTVTIITTVVLVAALAGAVWLAYHRGAFGNSGGQDQSGQQVASTEPTNQAGDNRANQDQASTPEASPQPPKPDQATKPDQTASTDQAKRPHQGESGAPAKPADQTGLAQQPKAAEATNAPSGQPRPAVTSDQASLPSEIVQTGPAEVIFSSLAVAGLTVAVTHWLRSRAALGR